MNGKEKSDNLLDNLNKKLQSMQYLGDSLKNRHKSSNRIPSTYDDGCAKTKLNNECMELKQKVQDYTHQISLKDTEIEELKKSHTNDKCGLEEKLKRVQDECNLVRKDKNDINLQKLKVCMKLENIEREYGRMCSKEKHVTDQLVEHKKAHMDKDKLIQELKMNCSSMAG